MKRRYVYIEGNGLVQVERVAPRQRIHIIGDHHEPFRSQADGRIYDSKSKYRADIKARGLDEVGNERAAFMRREEPKQDSIADDLARTFAELNS